MTDMRRVTVSLPDSIDKRILALRKDDRFIRCSYSEIVRQVLECGFERLARIRLIVREGGERVEKVNLTVKVDGYPEALEILEKLEDKLQEARTLANELTSCLEKLQIQV